MLKTNNSPSQIEKSLQVALDEESKLGQDLWQTILKQHPSDIAVLFHSISLNQQLLFIKKLPFPLKIYVFERLGEALQIALLPQLDQDTLESLLQNMHSSSVVNLFQTFSKKECSQYLKLIKLKKRTRVLNQMRYPKHSAGHLMHEAVLTLHQDMTVNQAINLVQRLKPTEQLRKQIFITDQANVLTGYINLDDLLLNPSETQLRTIIRNNKLLIYPKTDQEKVARQMRHFDLALAPVVDAQQHLLGVITATDVFKILHDEANEDIFKLSGISPQEGHYLQIPFWQSISQRAPWLVGLLMLQSVSSVILSHYDALLCQFTMIPIFLTMLIGTGGNTGNQSGAIIVRGLATGDINHNNAWRVVFREMQVALAMATILASVGFLRVYFYPKSDLLISLAISFSLFLIILTSAFLGTALPLLLERFNFDPAHSAAPFLSTLMDIIGIMIYCAVCFTMLG